MNEKVEINYKESQKNQQQPLSHRKEGEQLSLIVPHSSKNGCQVYHAKRSLLLV